MQAPDLSPKEKKFLNRQIRYTNLYLYFSIAGVAIGLLLTVNLIWNQKIQSGTEFVLVILILLGARANLKQHKDGKLFQKLTSESD